MRPLYQLNLQQQFGGGEVYTDFLCQALGRQGVPHTLLVHPDAPFWQQFNLPQTTLQAIQPDLPSLLQALPLPSILLTHGSTPPAWRQALKTAGHRLVGIAHMPLYGRDPKAFENYDGVIGVSQYVINSLHDAGVKQVYPEPWYGVAALARMQRTEMDITQHSCYDWDKRKGRDRLLSWLEPLVEPFRNQPTFYKKPGLTVGIVSRLTPIKQFPLLFEHIALALADIPDLNIEIFGSGGYASVRDLKQALRPLAERVRFWGHQHHVADVYAQLDFLLTGLPEKEALGLNVIEAQYCNLPVLAVDALPFRETVLDGKTGYLFTDPRQDGGKHLKDLVLAIQNGTKSRPQPAQELAHLQRFSLDTFTERVKNTLPWMENSAHG
jgi:glycosyltransferase involved in cell wall biosynthesis